MSPRDYMVFRDLDGWCICDADGYVVSGNDRWDSQGEALAELERWIAEDTEAQQEEGK